jgi:hypothetical protein
MLEPRCDGRRPVDGVTLKPRTKLRRLVRRTGQLLLDLSGDSDRKFILRRTRRAETAEERAIRESPHQPVVAAAVNSQFGCG